LKEVRGVFVSKVKSNSAAEDAGVKDKDVIISIDGIKINSSPELQEQVGKHNPGDKVALVVLRDNKEKAIDVVLKSIEGKTEIIRTEKIESNKILGAEFESLTRDERLKFHIANGVRLKKTGEKSILKERGVPNGYIVISVDKKAVSSLGELKAALENKKEGTLLEGINPDGSKGYYAIPPIEK